MQPPHDHDHRPPHRGTVIIIGEDHERVQPLLEELDGRDGVWTETWNPATGGTLVPTVVPDKSAVYLCRQSPSAYSRGNATSLSYTRQMLHYLTLHGCTVVNGVAALEAEASKAVQMLHCARAGLNVPHTVLAHTARAAIAAAVSVFGSEAVVVKPNHGGSGKGVAAYATGAAAAAAIRASSPSDVVDAQWVLQSYLGTYSNDPAVVKSILRFEIVAGKVQRDYVLQITAPSTEFSLCPCDPRTEQVLHAIRFTLLRDVYAVPGFNQPGVFDSFCAKVEAAFASAGAHIGSVEAVVLTGAHEAAAAMYPNPLEPVVFEMNFNTNYNERAEEAAGITPGVVRVADFLCSLLPKLSPAKAAAHGRTYAPSVALDAFDEDDLEFDEDYDGEHKDEHKDTREEPDEDEEPPLIELSPVLSAGSSRQKQPQAKSALLQELNAVNFGTVLDLDDPASTEAVVDTRSGPTTTAALYADSVDVLSPATRLPMFD